MRDIQDPNTLQGSMFGLGQHTLLGVPDAFHLDDRFATHGLPLRMCQPLLMRKHRRHAQTEFFEIGFDLC